MSNSIAILFSGGSDSTLAAVLAAERFKRVYLITYSHPFMFFHDKVRINARNLKNAFPDNEFLEYHGQITSLFRHLYFSNFLKYLRTHRTMMVSWICGACKIAMHLKTIQFCKTNGISHVWCGAHEESSAIFPAQMEPVIEDTKRLYAGSGIVYESPVYRLGRTDHVLRDRGILDQGDIKDQHLIYSTQRTCALGVILHAHSRLYYHRIHGLDCYRRRAHAIVRSKIGELTANELIDMDRAGPGPDPVV
jgi:hypothetical protein